MFYQVSDKCASKELQAGTYVLVLDGSQDESSAAPIRPLTSLMTDSLPDSTALITSLHIENTITDVAQESMPPLRGTRKPAHLDLRR